MMKTLYSICLAALLLVASCKKDETPETPTLIGKWVCTNIPGETYRLTFNKDNTFVMSIVMLSGSGSISGNYAYDESKKTISYPGSSILDYENVKFNSVSQWQTTAGGASLVWNKE